MTDRKEVARLNRATLALLYDRERALKARLETESNIDTRRAINSALPVVRECIALVAGEL